MILAVELLFEFKIILAPVHTVYYFPRFTAVQQNRADQSLLDRYLCLTCQVIWPQMFLQAAEAPICSLDSSLYLYTHVLLRYHKRSQVHTFVHDFEKATVCPASSIVLSPVAIMYFVFCSVARTASKFLPTMSISSA
jgi:hypothetical protein